MPDNQGKSFSARLAQNGVERPTEGDLRAVGASKPLLHLTRVATNSSGTPVLDFGELLQSDSMHKYIDVSNACSTPVTVWVATKPAWVEVDLPDGKEDVQLPVGGSTVVCLKFVPDQQLQEHSFEEALVFASQTQGQEMVRSTVLIRARMKLDLAWGTYRFGDTNKCEHDFGNVERKSVAPFWITMRSMGSRSLEVSLSPLPDWLQATDKTGGKLASAQLTLAPQAQGTFVLSPVHGEGGEGSREATVQLTTNDKREEFRKVSFAFRAEFSPQPPVPSVSCKQPEPRLVAVDCQAPVQLLLSNMSKTAVEVVTAGELPANLEAYPVVVPATGPEGEGRAEMTVSIRCTEVGQHEDVLLLQVPGEPAILTVRIHYECTKVDIEPHSLDFGQLQLGERSELSVRVRTGHLGISLSATTDPTLAEVLTLFEAGETVRAVLDTAKFTSKAFRGPGIELRLPELDMIRIIPVEFSVVEPVSTKQWALCPVCGIAWDVLIDRCGDQKCNAQMDNAQNVEERELVYCYKCETKYHQIDNFCLYCGLPLRPMNTEN